MLKENYEEVQKKITEACKRAGRNREEVTLIAVSKTKPVEMLSEIYDLGERNFGENKVQELTEKEEVLPKDIHWHMIGHLQRNKVKYIAGKVALIHSVEVGGGIKSAAWQQILADVYQEKIRIPKLLDEATSMGAAITGGVGVGLFADFSVVDKFVSIVRDVHPNPNNAAKYNALQDIFEDAYQSLVHLYEQLNTLRSE